MRDRTQQVLADELGVALRSYQCYEQGTRQPSISLIIKICDVLDISADWLLGRTDTPETKKDEQPL